MTPTTLAAYLRVVTIYAIAVAAAVGAGYEVVKNGDFNSPLVIFATSYISAILGFHIGITNPTPTDTTISGSVTPVFDPTAAAAAATLPATDATGAATPPVA